MNFDELKKIIEDDGWEVISDENIRNDSELDIRQYTPAGEDWGISVFFDGTVEDAINAIIEYAENYDYNDEQGELIAMRGQQGIPDDIETLVEDGKWKQEVLNDLATKLKKINLDENKKIENNVNKEINLYSQWIDLLDKIPSNKFDDYMVEYNLYKDDINGTRKPSNERLPELIKGAKKYVENKKITEADDENDAELNNILSDEDVKVNEILSELKDNSPLYERVISEIEEDSENYDGENKYDRISKRLEDISHGLSSGIVSSLIYYSDTSKFFEEYYDDIYDMLDDWEESGLQFLDTLKNNHSETEVIMNTDSVKNDVVWAVYEYIALILDDEISQI